MVLFYFVVEYFQLQSTAMRKLLVEIKLLP